MRIQDIIIAIMLFGIISIVLTGIALDMYDENDGYNVTIEDEYVLEESNAYSESRELVSDMADSAPGGTDGPQLTDVAENTDVLGLNVMSLIFKTPGIGQKIIFGEHNSSNSSQITSYGLISRLGINPIFGAVLITGVILIIAIILISSVLRNRW